MPTCWSKVEPAKAYRMMLRGRRVARWFGCYEGKRTICGVSELIVLNLFLCCSLFYLAQIMAEIVRQVAVLGRWPLASVVSVAV